MTDQAAELTLVDTLRHAIEREDQAATAAPAPTRVRCRHGGVWKRNPVTSSADQWLGDPYQPGLRISTVALERDHGPLEPLP